MPRKVNYGVDYDEDDYDDGYEDYDYDYDVQENCKLLFSVMSFECSVSMGITFYFSSFGAFAKLPISFLFLSPLRFYVPIRNLMLRGLLVLFLKCYNEIPLNFILPYQLLCLDVWNDNSALVVQGIDIVSLPITMRCDVLALLGNKS